MLWEIENFAYDALDIEKIIYFNTRTGNSIRLFYDNFNKVYN